MKDGYLNLSSTNTSPLDNIGQFHQVQDVSLITKKEKYDNLERENSIVKNQKILRNIDIPYHIKIDAYFIIQLYTFFENIFLKTILSKVTFKVFCRQWQTELSNQESMFSCHK